MKQKTLGLLAAAGITAALLLSGCATVNELEYYEFEGAFVASDLRLPPEAEINIDYNLYFDPENPLGTFVSIGSNAAKHSEASKAEERMRRALESVDFPGIFLDETSTSCTAALGGRVGTSAARADYLLDLEIERYGIDAESSSGTVSFETRITAQLYDNESRRLIWRRKISYHETVSPAVFGLPGAAGNLLTAAVLGELTEEEMASGFEQMAYKAARTVARRLEKDLYKVKYSS